MTGDRVQNLALSSVVECRMKPGHPTKDDGLQRETDDADSRRAVREGRSPDVGQAAVFDHSPAVEHSNKLANDLILGGPVAVAVAVAGENQSRVTIFRGKQSRWRDVVSVLIVSSDELSGTEVAKGAPLNGSELLLRPKGPLHNDIYKTEDFHQPTGRSPLNRGGKSV